MTAAPPEGIRGDGGLSPWGYRRWHFSTLVLRLMKLRPFMNRSTNINTHLRLRLHTLLAQFEYS